MLLINLYSCTDFNFIDGGLANGVHDCTMWEYFKNQPVDWDSTMVMIEHAGMKSYFDGSGKYKEITFFGITDLSIIRFLRIITANWTKKRHGPANPWMKANTGGKSRISRQKSVPPS